MRIRVRNKLPQSEYKMEVFSIILYRKRQRKKVANRLISLIIRVIFLARETKRIKWMTGESLWRFIRSLCWDTSDRRSIFRWSKKISSISSSYCIRSRVCLHSLHALRVRSCKRRPFVISSSFTWKQCKRVDRIHRGVFSFLKIIWEEKTRNSTRKCSIKRRISTGDILKNQRYQRHLYRFKWLLQLRQVGNSRITLLSLVIFTSLRIRNRDFTLNDIEVLLFLFSKLLILRQKISMNRQRNLRCTVESRN